MGYFQIKMLDLELDKQAWNLDQRMATFFGDNQSFLKFKVDNFSFIRSKASLQCK